MMASKDKETDASDPAWVVEETDEAKYNFSERKGVWEPKAEDILLMFEQLANGASLPLKWRCPGRRPPVEDVKEDEAESKMEVDEEEPKEEQEQEPEVSAFDFDDSASDVGAKMSPRRALGSVVRTPRTEKRVARMDNIMDSLRKQQMQRAAEREARKAKNSPAAGQGRGRLLNFSSPGARNLSPSAGGMKKDTPVSSAPRSAIFPASATAATTTTRTETDAAAEKMTNADGVNTAVSSTSVSATAPAVVVAANASMVNPSNSNSDKSWSTTSDVVPAAEEIPSVVQTTTATSNGQEKKDDENPPLHVYPPPASSSGVSVKTLNLPVMTSSSPTPVLQTSIPTSSETLQAPTTFVSSSSSSSGTVASTVAAVSESTTVSSRNSELSRSPGSAAEAGAVVAVSEKEAVVSGRSKSPRPSRSLTSSPAFSSTKPEPPGGGLARRSSGSPISSSFSTESKPLQASTNTNADAAGGKVVTAEDTDISASTEASPIMVVTMQTSSTTLSMAQPSVSPSVTVSDITTASVSTSTVITAPSLESTQTTVPVSVPYVERPEKEDSSGK